MAEEKKEELAGAETVLEDGSVQFTLPSGVVCVKSRFTAKQSKQCMKMAGGNEDQMMDAIISETCTFDGKKIFMDEIEDMDGMDYLMVLGKLSGVG